MKSVLAAQYIVAHLNRSYPNQHWIVGMDKYITSMGRNYQCLTSNDSFANCPESHAMDK